MNPGTSRSAILLCALVVLGFAAAAQQRTAIALPHPLLQVRDAEKPVALQSMELRTEISGSLAQTTVELVFHNPNARQLEGELQFPLLPTQQVTGFALDIDGTMRSAVPVPKDKGRQVFEAVERRRIDPALLEKTAGNHFKLRIYPIPAQGTRRVRLTYAEALRRDGDTLRLDLPVRLAERVGEFRLEMQADGGAVPRVTGAFDDLKFSRQGERLVARVERNAFHATSGLALQLPLPQRPQAVVQAFEGERYFLAEVPVAQAAAARALPNRIGLLWDASLSGGKRDRASELAVLDRYFKAVGDAEVKLILLRDRAEAAQAFRVRGGDWSTLKAALQDVAYDGASALADWQPEAGIAEYLLVSDGLINYGHREFPRLAATQRLFALDSSGAGSDGDWLSSIAEARGGRAVRWRGADDVATAANALLQEGVRLLSVDSAGATDFAVESMHGDGGVLRIAGRLTAPETTVVLQLLAGGKQSTLEVPVRSRAPSSKLAARLWASYTLRRLDADRDGNRARIARLGQQFAIPTVETSLLVLDDVADYVRYDIAPPAELREAFAALQAERLREKETSRAEHLDGIAASFAGRVAWWEKKWPKGAPPREDRSQREDAQWRLATAAPAAPPPAPAPASEPAAVAAAMAADAEAARMMEASTLDMVAVTGARREAAASDTPGEGVEIALQPWQPDSPYARRLRDAAPDQVYALYLDERDGHADSTAFYLDVADVLLQKGQRLLALRVLSNLAELDLENRHVLRVLGYRLLQADAPELALPIFRQVRDMAEEEPQSFRDLGLALAANGQDQAAIDNLYEVVARPWDPRFDGVALIAVGELNAIVARSRKPLDTRRIDPRLLRNLPLDLRAVLTWDSDNSDMDLWVTDPNGEKCYYSHQLTYQGGLISDDFTGGYGPEEFVLRDAKPGKYKVEANFFGDRQQLVTGATTLQLQLITGFGTPQQKEQRVTLRLKDAKETVLVGEFEVK